MRLAVRNTFVLLAIGLAVATLVLCHLGAQYAEEVPFRVAFFYVPALSMFGLLALLKSIRLSSRIMSIAFIMQCVAGVIEETTACFDKACKSPSLFSASEYVLSSPPILLSLAVTTCILLAASLNRSPVSLEGNSTACASSS